MGDGSIPQASAAHPDSAVRFTDATARLGGRDIWSHVDLTIDVGSFVAVLGPNGSGKSTLINAVLGLLPLAEGNVEVLGRPPGEAGGDIGYLPQRRSFAPSIRVRGSDVVRLGADGDKWGVPLPWGATRRARDARVEEVIDLVGASTCAGRPIEIGRAHV